MIQVEDSATPVETARPFSGFFSQLAHASSRVLMLDYDGTLARFRIDPAQATPYPGVAPLLRQIMTQTGTRIVLVSGRRAHDVLNLLGIKHLEVWGCHGLERLHPDGAHQLPEVDEHIQQALSDIDDLLYAEGIAELSESKPTGIAIHWRGREELAVPIMEKVRRIWAALPDHDGLRVSAFDGGVEIRLAARDKGDAVRTILSEMPHDVAAAYLGDDETDEDAFAVLKDRGLKILVADEPRPTRADAWIRPPAELLAFLKDWLTACGGAA